MLDFLSGYNLNLLQWVIVLSSAVRIGMSKTGLSGLGLMVVPDLASVFGRRPSVGLLLPILIFADVFTVTWYTLAKKPEPFWVSGWFVYFLKRPTGFL